MSVFNIISPKDADWGDHVAQFKRFRVERFILHPGRWTAISPLSTIQKLNWVKVRFDATGVGSLPDDKAGVYTFFAEPAIANHDSVRYLLYVGETHGKQTSLRARVRSYLREKRSTTARVHIVEMIERYQSHLWVYYALVKRNLVEQVEDELLAAYLPPFNRKYPAVVKNMIKAALT